jgi:hypothetical protein
MAGLTSAPVLPLSLDLSIETYVFLRVDFYSMIYLWIILELIQFRKLLSQGFSWLPGKKEEKRSFVIFDFM